MITQIISEYLNIEPQIEGVVDPVATTFFYFNTPKLKYCIYINNEEKTFAISGDFKDPFGAESLFEVIVPWDNVEVEKEPEAYGDWEFLIFRKDGEKTLMLRKTESGELSVWPELI